MGLLAGIEKWGPKTGFQFFSPGISPNVCFFGWSSNHPKYLKQRVSCVQGTQGSVKFPDLGVDFPSGRTNYAHAKQQHCRECSGLRVSDCLIPDQIAVIGTEETEDLDGTASLFYVVKGKDPSDPHSTVDFLLPRTEVRKDLLLNFEIGLLPNKTDHGNKKSQAAKGARQKARWQRKSEPSCKTKPKSSQLCLKLRKRPLRTDTSLPKQNAAGCPITKDLHKRRRTTVGILTCVLSCGLLLDFIEMWRGEQIDLVYVFLLQIVKDLKAQGVSASSIAYDNACKLWQKAQDHKTLREPWSNALAEAAIVLDHFHKKNHTWCLKHLPQVNPDEGRNKQLLANKNTEACEQLNSWITARTKSSLEMPPGRFAIYWWTLLQRHNAWLDTESACLRRRFLLGKMKHDPDKTKQRA